MAPGLNRGDKIDKPDNPNKPDKPENPGTEDKDDKKANKANKGTHIYTYDELNRMVSSNIAKEVTNYTYDTLGNLVLETVKNKSVDYEYNELNQLVKKTTSTNDTYTYSYDKRGNRIAETGKKASQSFVYDATNRMGEGTNWKGDKSAYTYNGLGLRVNNLVTTHAGQTYDRDYVIDYTSPENDDLYGYAMGNGQLEYEQRHVYAGSERLEQITEKGNGSWERTLYVHEDVMGNTRYYTKTTGQTFAELQYDAWGQPVSPNKLVNNDHGNYVFATFTGHIYDTTLDIYFAEARFYDATNRTWMAMDPIKDGLNWYQYCLSNPTTNWDPTGTMAVAVVAPYALAALFSSSVAYSLMPQEARDQIDASITNALSNAANAVYTAVSYFPHYVGCLIQESLDTIYSAAKEGAESSTESVPSAGKPGSKEWKDAKKKIRDGTGKGINVKTDSEKEAEDLLKEARPDLEKNRRIQAKGNLVMKSILQNPMLVMTSLILSGGTGQMAKPTEEADIFSSERGEASNASICQWYLRRKE